MKSNMNKQRVRFAPTCKVAVFVDRTKGIEDKLWYSSDDVDQFKLDSTLYARLAREQIGQGSFDGEIHNILGLEKLICKQDYYVRRTLLKASVLEEQAFQRLSSLMRLRSGLDVDSHGANARIATALANVAEENSRWARECAHVAGLALRRDLCEDKLAEQRPRENLQAQALAPLGAKTNFNVSNKRPYEAEPEAATFAGGATSRAVDVSLM